jgi:hypothetical protein
VIRKLAAVGFGEEMKEKEKEERDEDGLLSQDLVKMLEYCELSSPKKFKEKMKRLNIQYRAGPKTNAEMKVVPDGYKFKFTANNGKHEEQVKQELHERKQHRSERKIMLQEKVNNQQVGEHQEYRRRVLSKRTDRQLSRDRPLAPIKETTSHSTNQLHKVLSPPVPPPARRTNQPHNLPPNPPRSPFIAESQPSVVQSSNNTANFFKRDLGYAELHKLKQSEGHSKKAGGRSRDNKSSFRLNSIVE